MASRAAVNRLFRVRVPVLELRSAQQGWRRSAKPLEEGSNPSWTSTAHSTSGEVTTLSRWIDGIETRMGYQRPVTHRVRRAAFQVAETGSTPVRGTWV